MQIGEDVLLLDRRPPPLSSVRCFRLLRGTLVQGLHLTAKIQDRSYGLGSLRLKPRYETKPELYFTLRSPKPRGLVWSSDRFNRGLV